MMQDATNGHRVVTTSYQTLQEQNILLRSKNLLYIYITFGILLAQYLKSIVTNYCLFPVSHSLVTGGVWKYLRLEDLPYSSIW